MTQTETAFTFSNADDYQLLGIIHNPSSSPQNAVGLLIVVGGPQYRIGAHRQYIHMARHCANQNIPTMRFDYSGIGDSEGSYPGFEHVTTDIHAAIDEFKKQCPELKSVALWGLCEGASALLLGGARHPLVSHIILANPWVRTEAGLAKAYVKHYYIDRLKSPEFWKKLTSGRFSFKNAISGFWNNLKSLFINPPSQNNVADSVTIDPRPFPDRMLTGLSNFQGPVLLIQSEKDLVAREFDDLISSDKQWKQTIHNKPLTRIDIAETDHTFSTEKWRSQVAEATADWILSFKP
mgnify:CR=1 FL=1